MLRHLRDMAKAAGIWHIVAALVLIVASTTVLANNTTIASLLASGAASINGTDTVLYFSPYATDTLRVGDAVDVDVRINTKTPVNTVGATIQFPQDQLEILSVSKEHSFLNLWTEETTIKESDGIVRFSGGTVTKGGLTGVGTVLTLRVRAKKPGPAELSFKSAEVYAADGTGKEVESRTRSYEYDVPEVASSSNSASGGTNAASPAKNDLPALSIDFNGDGKVSVADLSIIAFQTIAPYNAKFDLDRDGNVGLSDLSIFFSRMKAGN